jgi:Tol biopolymer transport system component/DNA-binding winged helix-turn-helix (wHTH) protein
MSNKPYKLGDAFIYPDRNLIICYGIETQLPKKCIKVLNVLVCQQGYSVKREHLLDEVWGANLGSDELLNNAISKLRHAIGREFKSKKIIETVPKLGYRLSIKPLPISSALNTWKSPEFKIAALIVVLLFGSFFSIKAFNDKKNNVESELIDTLSMTELTKLDGLEYGPDYSPNGESILFAKVKSGMSHSDLYVQNLKTGDVEQITFDEYDEYYPKWNRKGNYIAYVQWNKFSCKIMVMYMPTHKTDQALDCTGQWPNSLNWSVQGEHLISSWETSLEQPYQIYHIDWMDNTAIPLIDIKSKHGDLFPIYSPSGNQIAWFRMHEKTSEIVIYNVHTQQEKTYEINKSVQNLAWSNGEDFLYIITMVNRSRYQLSTLNISAPNSSLENVTLIDGVSSNLSVSPISGDIVFDQYHARQQLMVINIATGERDVSMESSFRDDYPVFSSSGDLITFRSNRSGKDGIWQINNKKVKGSRLLFDTDKFIEGYTWLKEEKSLIYSLKNENYYQLYLYDVVTNQHSSLVSLEGDLLLPVMSENKEKVYFTHYLDGEVSLMSYDFVDQSREVVLKDAYMLRESHDRQWFYFFQFNKAGLWRIPSNGDSISIEQAELFIEDISVNDSGNWILHDNGVIYLSDRNNHSVIRNIDWNRIEISTPIDIDKKLMKLEGTNFAYLAKTQQLIVVTNDHYIGNIKRLTLLSASN